MKKIGLAIIIITIVGLLVYGFYQTTLANKLGQEVMGKFLNEYSKKISTADYADAYNNLTSDDFKKKYSLEDYQKAQMANLAEYGQLQSIKTTTNIFNKSKEPGQPWFYRVDLEYRGSKNIEIITFDMIEEDGVYKVYRTYKLGNRIDTLLEKIY